LLDSLLQEATFTTTAMIKRLLSVFIIPLFCITFLVLGLLINLVQLLCKAMPTTLFRKVNYYLVYGIHGYLLSVGDWWANNNIKIYCSEDLHNRISKHGVKEHALFLMNHHTELDWLYSWIIGDRMGILGNCRAFSKRVLRLVPIIGWSWAMSDMVFLARGDWEEDKRVIQEKLRILADYPSPVWLLLFPEGTRFTKEKHKASMEFASRAGLPFLEHHLTPRTKGFTFIMEQVDRKKFKTIYDITLVEEDGSAPFNISSIISGIPCTGNVYIRRIPLDSIPIDKVKSANWLHNFFKEKDEIKHRFLSSGKFTEDCTFVQSSRCVISLLLLVASNTLVLVPLLGSLVIGGWMTRILLLLLIGIALVAMKIIGDTTKIEKCSKYGRNNNKELVQNRLRIFLSSS